MCCILFRLINGQNNTRRGSLWNGAKGHKFASALPCGDLNHVEASPLLQYMTVLENM
jgi:hypothetical protein